jgi:hypothetical protein
MANNFFRRVQRGVRRAVRRASRAMPGPENERTKQRREEVRQAWTFSGKRQYAEAGEIFARLAEESLQNNEPILAQLSSQQAFKMWLQAKQPARALEQARHILRIRNQSGHLGSVTSMESLTRIAGELRLAGLASEADAFLNELNQMLKTQGLSLVSTSPQALAPAAEPRAGKLPAVCPQCGGRLPRDAGVDEIECYYCGSVVRAE